MIVVSQYKHHELTEDQVKAIVSLTNMIWPNKDKSLAELIADASKRREENTHNLLNNRTTHFVIWEGEKAIAHSRTFPRTIFTENGPLEVMALASVCVLPEKRGKDFGKAVVENAFEQINRGEFSVSLFQTGVPKFYEKLGCRGVSNSFFNSQNRDNPNANPFWDVTIMIYPAAFNWPSGKIDLNGPGY